MNNNTELRNDIVKSADRLDYKVKGIAYYFLLLDIESQIVAIGDYNNNIPALNDDGTPKTHNEYLWDIDFLGLKEVTPELMEESNKEYCERVLKQLPCKTKIRFRITIAKKFLAFLDKEASDVLKKHIRFMWFGGKSATIIFASKGELEKLTSEE